MACSAPPTASTASPKPNTIVRSAPSAGRDLPPAFGASIGNQIAERALKVVRYGVTSKMSRILVVEDETRLAMELAWLLQEAGYAVVGPERSVEEARKAL